MFPEVARFRPTATADSIPSYGLMVRAGLIRQVGASGLYAMMPNALRVVENLEKIIDEELGQIGCCKIRMPLLLSADLWHKTRRWESTGSEVSIFLLSFFLFLNDLFNAVSCSD